MLLLLLLPGEVTVNRAIDYETDEQLRFTVSVSDDGQPSLTSTATVIIEILNINDETPAFQNTDDVSGCVT